MVIDVKVRNKSPH